MAKLTPESAWEFADAIKAIVKPQTTRRKATVQNVDKDGTILVSLPGSSTVTPIQSTGANVSPGDTVLTELRGTSLFITENLTNPAIGENKARSIAKQETQHAEAMAKQAKTIADEANAVAEATNQHFWNDTNGAHITDVTQDEWTAAVADNFSDYDPDTKPYHNQLLNSLGILLRTALNNLVSITRSAIAFYDGTGNAASNIVAQFGSSGASIGKDSDLQLKMTAGAMSLENDTDETVFSVTEDSGTTITRTAELVVYASSSEVNENPHTVSDTLTVAGTPVVTVTIGTDSYTLDSTYATATATQGTGVTVALTSSGVTYVKNLIADNVESGGADSGTLVVSYDSLHYDAAKLDMSGAMTVDGEGNIIAVENSGWASTDKTDTMFRATNVTTGRNISFGIGNGGDNAGIYDRSFSQWLIYMDGSGVAHIGGQFGAAKNVDGSSVNTATSTWTQLSSISLSKGKWLVLVGCYAQSNTTGLRRWLFTTLPASQAGPTRLNMVTQGSPGNAGAYDLLACYVTPGSTTTYRVHGYQSSGGTLPMSAYIRAVRLG